MTSSTEPGASWVWSETAKVLNSFHKGSQHRAGSQISFCVDESVFSKCSSGGGHSKGTDHLFSVACFHLYVY